MKTEVQNFSWSFEEPRTESASPVDSVVDQKNWRRWWQRCPAPVREVVPYVGLVAVLILLLLARGNSTASADPGVFKAEALVPFSGFGKGDLVEAERLREIGVDRRDLSKTQLLQLVRPRDLEALHGKVRARRALPPGRPLFWSDLEIERPASAGPSYPQVSYGRDS